MYKLKHFVVATLNNNKLKEIENICYNYDVQVKSAKDYIIKLPPEDGTTFAENAAIKAKFVGKITKLPTLADDSGLCIEALNGEPGIYSSRLAGKNQEYSKAIKYIYNKIQHSTNYNAKFICVLALFMADTEEIEYFTGEVLGKLTFPPAGNNGHAYDVIFVPHGYSLTFAEMSPKLKNSISHRGKAFNLFAEKYLQKSTDEFF